MELTTVGSVEKRHALFAGAKQSDAKLAQVMPLLLVVASGGELGSDIRGIDEGEEIGGVVEDCVELEIEALQSTAYDFAFYGCEDLNRQLVHLIPEVLTGKQVDVYLGELAQSRRACPFGKSSLARSMTSPADTAQLEGLTSAETIMALGAAPWVRDMPRGMSVSAPAGGQVAIDRTGNVKLASNGEDSRDGAMGEGLDAKGICGLKPEDQIIGFTEVGNHGETWLSANTVGLDDAPVGVAANVDSLQACHG